jgi:hypothetical protein
MRASFRGQKMDSLRRQSIGLCRRARELARNQADFDRQAG